MKLMSQGMSVSLSIQHDLVKREEHLVSAAQESSAIAFAELQTLYSHRLYRTIARITQNLEDTEDAIAGHLSACMFGNFKVRGQVECLFMVDADRD